MDPKDIQILQLESGKPYLLGVGSFGSVCNPLLCTKLQYIGACFALLLAEPMPFLVSTVCLHCSVDSAAQSLLKCFVASIPQHAALPLISCMKCLHAQVAVCPISEA